MASFSLEDVIRLTSKFTVAQLLARDDFTQRYNSQKPIAITEFLYPLMQAYDSVMIKSDVEFGGTDQKFNCMVGRELQEMMGQKPQQVFLMPLLVGTDGVQKMSKSLGNYIGVDEPPADMYGKVMSIPDDLIMDYFELVTDVSDHDIADMRAALLETSVNPMQLKKQLGREIVAQFYHQQAALEAEENFEKIFQRRQAPQAGEIIKLAPGGTLTLQLTQVGLAKSRSEARRLLQQGGIEIDGLKIFEDPDMQDLKPGCIIKVGKRRFATV